MKTTSPERSTAASGSPPLATSAIRRPGGSSKSLTGTRKTEPIEARSALGPVRSAQPAESATPAPNPSAARSSVPTFPGSATCQRASVAGRTPRGRSSRRNTAITRGGCASDDTSASSACSTVSPATSSSTGSMPAASTRSSPSTTKRPSLSRQLRSRSLLTVRATQVPDRQRRSSRPHRPPANPQLAMRSDASWPPAQLGASVLGLHDPVEVGSRAEPDALGAVAADLNVGRNVGPHAAANEIDRGRVHDHAGRVRSPSLRTSRSLSLSRELIGSGFEGGLRLRRDRAERLRVADREVSEHLPVELDAGLRTPVHELVVRQPVRAGGRVDTRDPEPAEVPLLDLPVAIGVDERPIHLLLRIAVVGALPAPVPLRLLEDAAALLLRVDRALDARHLAPPLQHLAHGLDVARCNFGGLAPALPSAGAALNQMARRRRPVPPSPQQLPCPRHLEALRRPRGAFSSSASRFTPAFFVGPSTITMLRPSRSGWDSIAPISLTSSARRRRRSRPRSGWVVSRPRNMMVTFTFAR